nr:MAG TPA: hypothetical protein [Inoviridae sp.]
MRHRHNAHAYQISQSCEISLIRVSMQKKNRPRSSYVSKNDPLKCIARSSNPRHPDKEKWYLRGILSRFLTVYATRTV